MNERIWIYTLSKPLNIAQLAEFKALCENFVSGWTAHEVSLDASFELHKNRLLIIKVNEASYNASGCSIDKQLRFVKQLEQQFGIEMLNRLLVAYQNEQGEVQVAHQSVIKDLLAKHILDANTIVYNNTISNTSELSTQWELPLRQTWLSKYLEMAL